MPTTAELIRRGAAQHATRTAVRWGDDTLSYREVFSTACRIGNALQDAGVGRGAHVALLVGNGPASVSTDFGMVLAGAKASERRMAALGFSVTRYRLVAFVIAGMIYNLALGAINRAMPQLMVSMVGAPALTFGALALLAVVAPVLLSVWVGAFHDHLADPFRGPP